MRRRGERENKARNIKVHEDEGGEEVGFWYDGYQTCRLHAEHGNT